MHTGENLSAARTPSHFAASFGARQRRSPTGGPANGTPLKTRTSGNTPAVPVSDPCCTLTGSLIAPKAVPKVARRRTEIARRIDGSYRTASVLYLRSSASSSLSVLRRVDLVVADTAPRLR